MSHSTQALAAWLPSLPPLYLFCHHHRLLNRLNTSRCRFPSVYRCYLLHFLALSLWLCSRSFCTSNSLSVFGSSLISLWSCDRTTSIERERLERVKWGGRDLKRCNPEEVTLTVTATSAQKNKKQTNSRDLNKRCMTFVSYFFRFTICGFFLVNNLLSECVSFEAFVSSSSVIHETKNGISGLSVFVLVSFVSFLIVCMFVCRSTSSCCISFVFRFCFVFWRQNSPFQAIKANQWTTLCSSWSFWFEVLCLWHSQFFFHSRLDCCLQVMYEFIAHDFHSKKNHLPPLRNCIINTTRSFHQLIRLPLPNLVFVFLHRFLIHSAAILLFHVWNI